jgi:hypothetical protein
LFGTDEVAPSTQDKYLKIYFQYDPLWKALTPEVSNKVKRENYQWLFDEARRKVRDWEKANSAAVAEPKREESSEVTSPGFKAFDPENLILGASGQ